MYLYYNGDFNKKNIAKLNSAYKRPFQIKCSTLDDQLYCRISVFEWRWASKYKFS